MKWKTALGMTLVAVAVLGRFYLRGGLQWGPTNIEVIEAYQSKFAPLHATLDQVAERIAAEPPLERPQLGAKLLPLPVLHFDEPREANMSMVALLELQTYQIFDPMVTSSLTPEKRERLRFSVSEFDDFAAAIAWTGAANPLANSVWDKDGRAMEAKLRRALELQYLLVGRSRVLPDIEDDTASEPSVVDLFLVRLTDGEIVASTPLVGLSDTDDILAGAGEALAPHVDIKWPTAEERSRSG